MKTLVRGEFKTYVAAKAFSLAVPEPVGAQWLPVGARLETDGYQVKYEGQTFVYPQTRGAIIVGWLVEEEE